MLGAVGFVKWAKHILSILLSLEFIVLIVFFILMLNVYINSLFVGLVMLVFRVCEGALGLTILVSIARKFGGDYLRRLNLSL